MQMTEQELQGKLTNYGDFLLNCEESEQESEEYKSPAAVFSETVNRLEILLNRMRAYSSLLSAVSDSIANGGNDADTYVKAIEYLDDEIFIFLSDLDTLFEDANAERKNM